MGKTKGKDPNKITFKQDIFCKMYATDPEVLGNGTRAYIKAFNYKNPRIATACALAHRLIEMPKIILRIRQYLGEIGGFNDENVDKNLNFLIQQHADFKAKLGAIREYNVLRNRIKRKIDVSLKVEEIEGKFKSWANEDVSKESNEDENNDSNAVEPKELPKDK